MLQIGSKNVFEEKELVKEGNLHFMQIASSTKPVAFYSLDVIISVGYRVKSQRGVEFRRWATDVLKRYILQGHAENDARLRQLGTVARIIERLPGELASRQILDIVESYTDAYTLLDAYDREAVPRPQGVRSTYVLDYHECIELIAQMRPHFGSDIFGREKDESFRGSIAAIYQSYGGEELYPSLEEKAANLLYFIIKNHSFVDGNRRIACSLFLYFLDRNDGLFRGIEKRVSDSTLVAMALMIAESRPEEKETMVALVMNFLAWGWTGIGPSHPSASSCKGRDGCSVSRFRADRGRFRDDGLSRENGCGTLSATPVSRQHHVRASPSGKASASQADTRGFESRCPLHHRQTPVLMWGRRFSYGACGNGAYTVAIAYVCPSTTLHVYPDPSHAYSRGHLPYPYAYRALRFTLAYLPYDASTEALAPPIAAAARRRLWHVVVKGKADNYGRCT